jgi:sensor histidine kinase regulating citrate/malate metabolism
MKNLSTLNYLVATALITVIMLLIYATVQQTYRTGLNDPQIQIARDISSKLEQGKTIEPFIAADSIDISRSLSPFIVLYDVQGKAIRSNAFLDGKMPQVPVGLFDIAKNDGEYRVSWQPRKGIRMAMVIVKTNASLVQFVASGRSMTEVEERTQQMRAMVFFAWVICLVIISITAILNHFMRTKRILQKTA